MRLFIAINPDTDTKEKILAKQNELHKYFCKGNFSRYELLHLTVIFLGEIEPNRLSLVKKIISSTELPKFDVSIKEFGTFKNTNLCWLAISADKVLYTLYSKLQQELIEEGFDIETRKFNPHLTIARELVKYNTVDLSLNEIIRELNKNNKSDINFTADRISLMKSERIAGKLTYTEIFSHPLI